MQCTMQMYSHENDIVTVFRQCELIVWYTMTSSICFGSTPKHTIDICRHLSLHVDSFNHYHIIDIIVFNKSYLGNVNSKQNKLSMYRPMRPMLILGAFYSKSQTDVDGQTSQPIRLDRISDYDRIPGLQYTLLI